jgi:hypothetical protein
MPHSKRSFSTSSTIVVDWKKDPEMINRGGLDIVEALSPDGIYSLLKQGKAFGKVMEDQGMFESLPQR